MPGREWSWYQLRIGNTADCMSGLYVSPGLPSPMPALPLGRALDGCSLYAQLGDAASIAQLAVGTDFHILAETSDGWRHIRILSGALDAAMDENGTYGYVHKDDMIAGASASALDAWERDDGITGFSFSLTFSQHTGKMAVIRSFMQEGFPNEQSD